MPGFMFCEALCSDQIADAQLYVCTCADLCVFVCVCTFSCQLPCLAICLSMCVCVCFRSLMMHFFHIGRTGADLNDRMQNLFAIYFAIYTR